MNYDSKQQNTRQNMLRETRRLPNTSERKRKWTQEEHRKRIEQQLRLDPRFKSLYGKAEEL